MKTNNSTCCLIFTKNPIPGKVKTRLIPSLGIEGAYKVHLQLLKYTLSITSKITSMDFQLHYTDFGNNQLIKSLAKENNLDIQLQLGHNLGERMFNASDLCLKKYSHCIIIGTDCPELTQEYLLLAEHQLLSGFDAVIGPAADGGYVLIGYKYANSALFSDIEWGTNTVYSETLKKMDSLNLNYNSLDTLHDIDREDDLRYLPSVSN